MKRSSSNGIIDFFRQSRERYWALVLAQGHRLQIVCWQITSTKYSLDWEDVGQWICFFVIEWTDCDRWEDDNHNTKEDPGFASHIRGVPIERSFSFILPWELFCWWSLKYVDGTAPDEFIRIRLLLVNWRTPNQMARTRVIRGRVHHQVIDPIELINTPDAANAAEKAHWWCVV